MIEQSFGAPKITKDGVTVAKAIDSSRPEMPVRYTAKADRPLRSVAGFDSDKHQIGVFLGPLPTHPFEVPKRCVQIISREIAGYIQAIPF